jgi:hypothetical protein
MAMRRSRRANVRCLLGLAAVPLIGIMSGCVGDLALPPASVPVQEASGVATGLPVTQPESKATSTSPASPQIVTTTAATQEGWHPEDWLGSLRPRPVAATKENAAATVSQVPLTRTAHPDPVRQVPALTEAQTSRAEARAWEMANPLIAPARAATEGGWHPEDFLGSLRPRPLPATKGADAIYSPNEELVAAERERSKRERAYIASIKPKIYRGMTVQQLGTMLDLYPVSSDWETLSPHLRPSDRIQEPRLVYEWDLDDNVVPYWDPSTSVAPAHSLTTSEKVSRIREDDNTAPFLVGYFIDLRLDEWTAGYRRDGTIHYVLPIEDEVPDPKFDPKADYIEWLSGDGHKSNIFRPTTYDKKDGH